MRRARAIFADSREVIPRPLPHLLPLTPATGLKFSLGVTHANNDFTFAIERRFFGQQLLQVKI